jgi:hypothetical protein
MHLVWSVFVTVLGIAWSYCACRGIKEYYHEFRIWELHRQHPNESIFSGRLKNGKWKYFIGREQFEAWRRAAPEGRSHEE